MLKASLMVVAWPVWTVMACPFAQASSPSQLQAPNEVPDSVLLTRLDHSFVQVSRAASQERYLTSVVGWIGGLGLLTGGAYLVGSGLSGLNDRVLRHSTSNDTHSVVGSLALVLAGGSVFSLGTNTVTIGVLAYRHTWERELYAEAFSQLHPTEVSDLRGLVIEGEAHLQRFAAEGHQARMRWGGLSSALGIVGTALYLGNQDRKPYLIAGIAGLVYAGYCFTSLTTAEASYRAYEEGRLGLNGKATPLNSIPNLGLVAEGGDIGVGLSWSF